MMQPADLRNCEDLPFRRRFDLSWKWVVLPASSSLRDGVFGRDRKNNLSPLLANFVEIVRQLPEVKVFGKRRVS